MSLLCPRSAPSSQPPPHDPSIPYRCAVGANAQPQPRPDYTLYGESEDAANNTHSKVALARRDLSGKRAHATSEVSTAACSRHHSSHAHTALCRDGLWHLLTGDVCNGTCCRRRLDDAACSRDVEEVVAAGLQTCSANVCMTHVRTAARSHTHCDQLSNASAAHFVREDEDPCKMTYSRMALIERDLSATTQMQMHSQMGFSCSNRRAARLCAVCFFGLRRLLLRYFILLLL